jgi:hypothetical protein
MTLLLPQAGIGIAVYANALTNVVVPLAHALAGTLLGLRPRDWLAYYQAAAAAIAPPKEPPPAAGTRAERDLTAYAGVYTHPADGELIVEAGAEALAGRWPDGYLMAFDAAPLGGHRFAIRYNQMPTRLSMVGHTLAFETDGDAVTAAVVHISPGVTRVFQRSKG